MANLLAICKEAMQADGRFRPPSTIVNNNDPTAIQLLALANRTGRTLAYDHSWQVLLTTHTFDTAASTETYALPSDFHRFANMTQWDRANTTQMVGPIDAVLWEALRSGDMVGAGINKYFRVAGNLFSIWPTPTAVEEIAYQYYSKNWITSKAAFSADTDEPLLDSDLFILGIRYRFLSAKGLPFGEEKAEYLSRRDSLLAADGGKAVLQFVGGRRVSRYEGIPDTGYGL